MRSRWAWLGLIGWGVAQAGDDALRFSAVTSVLHGQEDPRLLVTVRPGGTLKLQLGCGARRYDATYTLAPGSEMVIPLRGLAAGVHQCEGMASVVASDGSTGDLPLSLTVALLPRLDLKAVYQDIDFAAHTLQVHADRAVSAASVTVIGPGGALIGEAEADLSDPLNPRFQWPAGGAEVVKFEVVAQDELGFRSMLTLSPWSYAIPHVDVVFASNSATITAEEAPKLEQTWAELTRVLELYGQVVEVKLFVAGYTDTVGAGAANQTLSERRAQAIAQWFRKRGFSGPIAYQGFGERALAVPTGDEVDEQLNRRAAYIVAAQVPPISEQVPADAWRSL